MTCVLCGDTIPDDEIESPFENGAIYDTNPNTKRTAWMHGSCWQVAWEDKAEERHGE